MGRKGEGKKEGRRERKGKSEEGKWKGGKERKGKKGKAKIIKVVDRGLRDDPHIKNKFQQNKMIIMMTVPRILFSQHCVSVQDIVCLFL